MADPSARDVRLHGYWQVGRVALDEEGFRKLVRGEVVELRTADDHRVELILSDIGFGRMVDAVNEAIIEAPAPKRWRDDP